jgi:hypothetical protein
VDASEVLFPPLDSPQQSSEYAATYYSDELDAVYMAHYFLNLVMPVAKRVVFDVMKTGSTRVI